MTTISAKIVLASQHAVTGDRIASLLLRYPRCIHAEFMTHRMISKNSASSRAIPTSKLIQSILDDPFVPLHWGKNQKGMQAGEEHNALVTIDRGDRDEKLTNEDAWLDAMHSSVYSARQFDKAGYHKQIVNRLIEPFMHITVFATAMVGHEGWDNFLALRDHSDAEPHIQILAREIRKALDGAKWQILRPGEWHLPWVSQGEVNVIARKYDPEPKLSEYERKALIKLSVARSASTSYKTVDDFDMTLDRAIDLHDKLVTSRPMHASPLEHVCYADHPNLGGETGRWQRSDLHGNFHGFCQYRKTLEGECA